MTLSASPFHYLIRSLYHWFAHLTLLVSPAPYFTLVPIIDQAEFVCAFDAFLRHLQTLLGAADWIPP